MSGTDLKQRLAAILAADAAGYSRLMSLDERATVNTLDAARKVFRTHIESNQGRVIDMAGDSVLAVFETAAGAVSAALSIQRQINPSADTALPDRRMLFRIGVHLGDVVEKPDGTVYGDGVNIAARLEGLAEPGGITISDSVRIAVKGKVSAAFEDQGEQTVKNIADPVRAYRVRAEGVAASQTPERTTTSFPSVTQITPSLPDRPSIAVLPFINMSGDPEQEYFVDGMVEDIITELSRFQRLFVIARNTSFTYRGKSVDVKKVALELGVHFILEGSVRKSGDRVRISAQLIDGQTGQHVWAERYDDVLADVFELQERITRQVVGSMVWEIEAEETRMLERGQRRFAEADDIAWMAAKALNDGTLNGEPALTLDAIRLAEQAIEKDRNCRMAWYVLSSCHTTRVFYTWTQDRLGSIAAARRAATELMILAPGDSRSYFVRGRIETIAGDFGRGVADLRRASQLNPNDPLVLFYLSWNEAADGNLERAKDLAAQAIRISPKDRFIGAAYLACAMAEFIAQDFCAMRHWAELAIQANPSAPIRRVMMIVYASEAGDTTLLNLHLERLRSISPGFLPTLFRGDYLAFQRPEHMRALLNSLHKAGLGADATAGDGAASIPNAPFSE